MRYFCEHTQFCLSRGWEMMTRWNLCYAAHEAAALALILSLIYLAVIGWRNPEIHTHTPTGWRNHCVNNILLLSMCVRACMHVYIVIIIIIVQCLSVWPYSLSVSFFINAIFHYVVYASVCVRVFTVHVIQNTKNVRRCSGSSGSSVHSSNSFSLDKVPNILTS